MADAHILNEFGISRIFKCQLSKMKHANHADHSNEIGCTFKSELAHFRLCNRGKNKLKFIELKILYREKLVALQTKLAIIRKF